MAKLLAFFMSIFYFLSTVGLFPNKPLTINVTDENNEPVVGVVVSYGVKDNDSLDYYGISPPIGKTDGNGNVVWENHYFGECTLFIKESEDAYDSQWQSFTVDIPLTGQNTIEIEYVSGQK